MEILSDQRLIELAKPVVLRNEVRATHRPGTGCDFFPEANSAVPFISLEKSVHPDYGRRGRRSSKKCAGGRKKEGSRRMFLGARANRIGPLSFGLGRGRRRVAGGGLPQDGLLEAVLPVVAAGK